MQIEAGKYYRRRDGKKRGPAWTDGNQPHPWCVPFDESEHWYRDDGASCLGNAGYDIIAEWTEAPTGPVRTVTRKEIVPGVYGRVRVYDETCEHGHVCMGLPASYHWTATELRAAVATLSEIADALEGGAA